MKRVPWRAVGVAWTLGVLLTLAWRSPLLWPHLRARVENRVPIPARMALPGASVPVLPATSVFRDGVRHHGVHRGSAVGPHLQVAWRQGGLNVGVHGASKGSVAVDERGLVVGGDSGWIWAMDHDGRIQWRVHAGSADRGVHGTAALDAQTAFLGAYNGTLYAVDRATGGLRYTVDTGVALGASPVPLGDALLLTPETTRPANGYVTLLDRATGQVRWVSEWLGDQSHSTVTVSADGALLFVGDNARTLRALRVADGTTVWRSRMPAEVKSCVPQWRDLLVVTVMVPTVFGVDAATGAVRWTVETDAGTSSSPAIWEEQGVAFLVSGSGATWALDLASGSILWMTPGQGFPAPNPASRIRPSPLLAWGTDGRPWLFTECQPAHLCTLNPANGVVEDTVALEGRMTGAPVAWGGSLYVSENAPGGVVRLTTSSRVDADDAERAK